MSGTDETSGATAVAKAAAFHIAEYEALRAQIRDNVAGLRFIRNALLIVPGVVYGAMIANLDSLGLAAAAGLAWIPIVLHVFIMRFWNAEAAAIGRIAGYVREIEKTYAYAGLKGWETVAAEQKGRAGTQFRRVLAAPWWLLFLAMTALAAGLTAVAVGRLVFGIEGVDDLQRLLAG